MFGTIFTTRLTDNLKDVFTAAGASATDAGERHRDPRPADAEPAARLDARRHRQRLRRRARAGVLVPAAVHRHRVRALALFLKQIPLSDVAGLVARGEAIGGEEAELLEAQLRDAPKPADGRERELVTTGTIRAGSGADGPGAN